MFCAWAEEGKWTHRSFPHVPLRSCLAGRSLLCIQGLRHSDVLPSSVPEVQPVSRNLRPQMQFALELWSERKAPRTPGTWEGQQTTCGRPARARLQVACSLHVVISFRVRLGPESETLAVHSVTRCEKQGIRTARGRGRGRGRQHQHQPSHCRA